MIAFACPQCARPIQAEDALAGKETDCPHCGRPAVVPSPAPPDNAKTEATGAAPAAPSPPSAATEHWSSPGDSGTFHSVPPSGEIPVETGILAPAREPDEIGRLGPYRVLKILGAGGMGVVFQGHDPVLLRTVAIKAMLPSVAAKPANRERFLREARTAAAIENDHIVPIYQVGEERGIAYLVMRLLQGETLEARMRRERPLPLAEALRIAREIAEGLAAAHERGLIHRDIKPANVWLEAPRGRVKILDFGLARPAAEDSGLTQAGVIMGTPAYMSPEQARGKPVDHRGDLFSLGCVLYQMTTGCLPFQGTDTLSRLLSLAADEPRPIRDLNAAVPAELAALATQLLAKNPNHRFPTARGVVEAIEIVEAGQGFATRPAASPSGNVLDLGDASVGFEDENADTLPAQEEAEADAVAADWVDELADGALAHYQIEALLGQGFHGAIFQARDLNDGRAVALKVLEPEFPRTVAEVQHFIRAMQPLLPLRHPNLVGLVGAGKTGPYCWMALELVQAESVTRRIERLRTGRQKWDWRRGLRMAIHVARALEFASDRRLSHRNITPENLLWDRDAKVARLSDLMLREALKGSALQRERAEEKRRAELPYLSPEEVEGSGGDDISDLYSLGTVVYALLTGRPPFLGESEGATVDLILGGQPVKPRKHQRAIPADFEWVVLTMLARDRKYRFQTPAELLVHLERIAVEQGLIL